MRERIEKRLVLVLSVQFDEACGEIAEGAGGCERAVDERSTASLAADFAPDDQLLIVGVFEDRFDRGDRFARADQISGGARTEQQADRFDEDRLAGARLPRQDVEPRLELDLDGLDHRQVADAEET